MAKRPPHGAEHRAGSGPSGAQASLCLCATVSVGGPCSTLAAQSSLDQGWGVSGKNDAVPGNVGRVNWPQFEAWDKGRRRKEEEIIH